MGNAGLGAGHGGVRCHTFILQNLMLIYLEGDIYRGQIDDTYQRYQTKVGVHFLEDSDDAPSFTVQATSSGFFFLPSLAEFI